MQAAVAAALVMAGCAAIGLSYWSARPTSMLQYNIFQPSLAPDPRFSRNAANRFAYRSIGHQNGGRPQEPDMRATFAKMSALEKVANQIEEHENLWGSHSRLYRKRVAHPALHQPRMTYSEQKTKSESQPMHKINLTTRRNAVNYDKLGLPKHVFRDPSDKYLKIVSPP
ncbi:hypothetical protein GUITHDRAFT_152056 [Guillardia theta CCMP2712]|uniref:Uncharacterized protein n=1 Tax=Guillardia theta (strain CCMP2712) TaxID=905079 RepID=L1JHW3_GUITC|nr:hypothetical protein GUITHDRAFT_152056 [Guillardia theta CCMP2712]EKX47685.1 hypothetical protein GUITHDRAFT_152056 [Guillardia theta CCMP2712]|eukprot:XP_005834665.1 hypothetical protein GUITHDRAFT_152056 [Guillardia theta CCMP2712]